MTDLPPLFSLADPNFVVLLVILGVLALGLAYTWSPEISRALGALGALFVVRRGRLARLEASAERLARREREALFERLTCIDSERAMLQRLDLLGKLTPTSALRLLRLERERGEIVARLLHLGAPYVPEEGHQELAS